MLRADESTKEMYPFDFELEIGYRFDTADEIKLAVSWKVTNRGGQEMYFSIGGHPGFLCPPDGKGGLTDCRLLFDTKDKIISRVVGSGSLLSEHTREYILRDGVLDITEDLFAEDALVIEQDQVHKISLCDGSSRPFVTVSFDAPLLALWAPAKKNVPFVCVEPWYGRGDRETFAGELSQREYGNKLAPSEVFYAEYTIEV
ncbi:MAG: aldose 1-epimerase family protein, partial [Acetatifactor sp.]|nr:aldose 1-epimerase family protein [Acetatifactor sp.]